MPDHFNTNMFHLLSESLSDTFPQHEYVCGALFRVLFANSLRVYADNDIAITESAASNAPS